MTAGSILKVKGNAVYSIAGGSMLADAAKMLKAHQIGAVLVVNERSSVQGILGEREIIAAIADRGAGALLEPVKDHMVTKFVTCTRVDSDEKLMHIMTNSRLRHIPVVEGGALLGVVSIGDVVKRRIADAEHEAGAMRDYIAGRPTT